jgi:hypothetical protein
MATIRIPLTPRTAYNPDRPANALLLAQVRELEKAVRARGRQVKRYTPRTEAEAAAYIRHLHRALHHQVLLPQIRRKPVRMESPSPRRRTAAKKR